MLTKTLEMGGFGQVEPLGPLGQSSRCVGLTSCSVGVKGRRSKGDFGRKIIYLYSHRG